MRSNHKRLRLNRIELKYNRFEEMIARICQDVSENVTANVCYPVNNILGDVARNGLD